MALVCIHFSQLVIQLISIAIHFHESCHSFESFKRMHCPPSHCLFVWSSHVAKSFVVPPDVQREVEKVLPLQSKQSLCQYYGYLIHIIPELCYKFCVVNVGFIMALLQRDYSCRHQLIIREIVLETNLVP